MRRLDARFYADDALAVAPALLGKVMRAGGVAGRIIEVEAYRDDDPASHSFAGRTPRNSTMFQGGGTLYVYLSYGLHHCANVVTGAPGVGQAVLLRALEPIDGLDVIAERRPGRSPGAWTSGPGKLCAALAIDRSHDGVDLCDDAWFGIYDDGVAPPAEPVAGPRIGISVGIDLPWRFQVPPAPTSSPRRVTRQV